MDKVVKVRRSFLNELRGFCNRFASLCSGCFHRPCDCSLSDEIAMAKSLIFRIDNIRDAEEERFYIENPQLDRFATVRKALEQAGRPLMASEIRIGSDWGRYRRQKKHQILALMCRRRLLSSFERDGRRLYALPEWREGENKENNRTNKETDHGIQP